MSNVQGLTAALGAKRNLIDSYTETEVQSYLDTKANEQELVKINLHHLKYVHSFRCFFDVFFACEPPKVFYDSDRCV